MVRVPLHACEHFYIITKPMEGIDSMMPGEIDHTIIQPVCVLTVKGWVTSKMMSLH